MFIFAAQLGFSDHDDLPLMAKTAVLVYIWRVLE